MDAEDKKQIVSSLLGMFPNYNQHLSSFMNIKELDLTKSQLKVLLILTKEDSLSMGELAEKMCISREQASRVINSLADRDLIDRTIHPGNRRQIDISLSEEGRRQLSHMVRTYSDAMFQALDKLTSEELQDFLSALNIVIRTLDKICI